MTYSRTAEKMNNAKRALLEALRTAESEGLPQSIVRQIDTLTGKAEALENKLSMRVRK